MSKTSADVFYDDPNKQPKHIPLPFNRGEKQSDDSLDKDNKNFQWHCNIAKERGQKLSMSEIEKGRPVERKRLFDVVPRVADINYGQHWTDSGNISKLRKKTRTSSTTGHTFLTTHTDEDGKQHAVVQDGHHALMGSIVGRRNPVIRHRDLDKEAEILRKQYPHLEPKDDEY